MNATAELIAPSDPRWGEVLAATQHDFHHLPAYAELSGTYAHGEAVALFAECGGARVLIPLVIRDVPGSEWRDATSPYGYPGPLFHSEGDGRDEDFAGCVASLRVIAREHRLVAAFVRTHPLLAVREEVLSPVGTVMRHGTTVVADLSRPREVVEQEIRRGVRYDVRRLRKHGFHVVMNDWDRFPDFGRIYRETMQRVNAAPEYMFSDDYLDRFRAALGHRLELCIVETGNGSVAAAGLFTSCDGIVQYHLSGTASDQLRLAPTKLMLYDMVLLAHERGMRWFHFGGGVGSAEDDLFQFKAAFSAGRAPFRTFRAVFDTAGYEALTARWREQAGGAEPPAGYFPAYRAPLPSP